MVKRAQEPPDALQMTDVSNEPSDSKRNKSRRSCQPEEFTDALEATEALIQVTEGTGRKKKTKMKQGKKRASSEAGLVVAEKRNDEVQGFTENVKARKTKKASDAKVAGKELKDAQDLTVQASGQMLKCIDCEQVFVFSVDEQRMFKDFGWEVKPPKRCQDCRREKKERNQRIAAKEKELIGKGKGKSGKDGKRRGCGQTSRTKEGGGKDFDRKSSGKSERYYINEESKCKSAKVCEKFKEGRCAFGERCRLLHSW